MNLQNTLTTTCPCCHTSFQLDHDNVRQADFKWKFPKYKSVNKTDILKALDGADIAEDEEDEDLNC